MVSVFASPDTFEKSWQALEQKTNAFASAKGLTFEQKLEALVDIFIEANRIHPFPEGNGRSLQVFMRELAREQGVDLDYSKTNPKEWNMASAISGTYGKVFEEKKQKYLISNPPDPEPIKRIFSGMARPARDQGLYAPRHDLDKNPAQIHVNAMGRLAENLGALKQNPALSRMPAETLEKMAYFRGIAQEGQRYESPEAQHAALSRFDKALEDPAFVERLKKCGEQQEPATERTRPERVRKDEQSL